MFNLRKHKQDQNPGYLNSKQEFTNSGENSPVNDLARFSGDRVGSKNADSKISSNHYFIQILADILRQKREEPVDTMVFDNPNEPSPGKPTLGEFDQSSREFIASFFRKSEWKHIQIRDLDVTQRDETDGSQTPPQDAEVDSNLPDHPEPELPITDVEAVQFSTEEDDKNQNQGNGNSSTPGQLLENLGPDDETELPQIVEKDSSSIPDQTVITVENVLPATEAAQVETTNIPSVNTDTGTSSDGLIGVIEPEQDTTLQSMADGHMAVHELVLHSDATHVAIADGDWFNPATWSGGTVPDDGARVLIPERMSVEYRGESDVLLFTVRVDGELTFAHDANNFMEVDTLVVTSTGRLEIGTAKTPVEQGYTTQIQIADNGPIDVAWDGMLLSRGIISQGAVEMHGQAKQTHLKLAVDAMAGDTQLVLEVIPEGWNIGDKIVLTGTHLNPWHYWSLSDGFALAEDEEFSITGIAGNAVTLDRPMSFDHDTSDPAHKASVANYTRSIIINTENPDATPVSERGHVMLMGAGEDTSVKYVSFHELGRTDKSVRAVDAEQTPDLTSDSNVKGRYALHLHEAGIDPDDVPIILEGNAVWGSPGWGIVQHGSFAHLLNNATYDTFGAAFVAEAGNEIGRWSGNIAVKAQGVLGIDKNSEDVEAFDLGRTGDGYWLQSRLIDVTDNVAAGVNRGFVFFHRGGDKNSLNTDLFEIPEFGRYLDHVSYNYAPIRHFTENEVMASNEGLVIVKDNPTQHHDIRSLMDKFTAWEVGLGISAEYTAHYTFSDIALNGSESDAFRKSTTGFEFGTASFDLVLNGGSIDGFDYGAYIVPDSPSQLTIDDQNLVLVETVISNSGIKDIGNLDLSRIDIYTYADLSEFTELDINIDQLPIWSFENPDILISAVKTDGLGDTPLNIATESLFINREVMERAIEKNGHYENEDGRRYVIWEEYYSDRLSGKIDKIGIPIEISSDVPSSFFDQHSAVNHGSIDFGEGSAAAVDDGFEVLEERSHEFDVLNNDDFASNSLSRVVDSFTQPENGIVHRTEQGTLLYRPDQNFTGDDEFDYWIQSDNGTFDRANVHIRVDEQPIVSTSWLLDEEFLTF